MSKRRHNALRRRYAKDRPARGVRFDDVARALLGEPEKNKPSDPKPETHKLPI